MIVSEIAWIGLNRNIFRILNTGWNFLQLNGDRR